MANTEANEAGQATSGEESYSAKLSLGTLGVKGAAVLGLTNGDTKIAVARFYGKVSDVKQQLNKDTNEAYTFFVGNFEGVNLLDGTYLRSGKLFLPKGVSEMMETAINALHEKEGKKGGTITFGFEIRSVKSSNKAGYTYEAAALKKPEEEDELAALRLAIRQMPTYEQRKLNAAGGEGTAPGSKTVDAKQPVKKSA